MKIYSMTAFGRGAEQTRHGDGVWEIRSVNHRFLEVTIRLPEAFRELEPVLREKIRDKIQRGKIECFFKFTPVMNDETAIKINAGVLKQLASASQEIEKYFSKVNPANAMQILTYPGVVQTDDTHAENLQKTFVTLFTKTLEQLIANRAREGAGIASILTDKLTKIKSIVKDIKHNLPDVVPQLREKLLQRFQELKITLNPERLEQEMVLSAQRLDITEEVDRLQMHVAEIEKTLHNGGTIGRRLDFLIQELHREANTMASKSADLDILSYTLELRVLIEQIREQVQNIE